MLYLLVKTLNEFVLVLIDAPFDVVADADVKVSDAVGHDVDEITGVLLCSHDFRFLDYARNDRTYTPVCPGNDGCRAGFKSVLPGRGATLDGLWLIVANQSGAKLPVIPPFNSRFNSRKMERG
jgi:hypothetical protein